MCYRRSETAESGNLEEGQVYECGKWRFGLAVYSAVWGHAGCFCVGECWDLIVVALKETIVLFQRQLWLYVFRRKGRQGASDYIDFEDTLEIWSTAFQWH